MKMLNTRTRRLSVIALAAILIASVCVVNHLAATAEDSSGFLAFGVAGITTGQTARLHAISLGVGEVQSRLALLAAQSPVRRHWVGEHVVVIEPPLPPLSLFLNFVGIIGRSVSVGVFVVVECYHSRFSQGDRL